MTFEIYIKKKQALQDQCKRDIETLKETFALSHNPHKIGDVVSDNKCTIRIESIKIDVPFGTTVPCCVYMGCELKKDLTPKKNGENTIIWQTNIKQ